MVCILQAYDWDSTIGWESFIKEMFSNCYTKKGCIEIVVSDY